MNEQESKQQTFDEATQAYVSKYAIDNVSKEENALRLDAANNEDPLFTHQPDSRFAFAVLNWNDTCTDVEQYKFCGEVSDTLRRTPYADPYNLLELLNETLKKLAYQFKHTDDPNQLCKLANSQVRVAGAMPVINEKLERKHAQAIQTAEQRALNAPPVEVDP